MKDWQKFAIIFAGCGAIGVLSYLGSTKPDIIVFVTAGNMAIAGLIAYFTGFRPTGA